MIVCIFIMSILIAHMPCTAATAQTKTITNPGYSSLKGTTQKPCPIWLTVFIHGAIKGQLVRCNLFKVWIDDIEDSHYERAICTLREDPFFWQAHAIQGIGLKKIAFNTTDPLRGASGIAYIYDQITQYVQKQPTINYYYTFGWSGLLSTKIRFNESQILYEQLLQEIKRIKEKEHVTPHVRLVCFSHGGNVAMGLEEVKNKVKIPACLMVDELVLWGTPIQRETDHLIAGNTFNKIYHHYSSDDGVQTADFFSFKRFFSNRKFHQRSTFPLPDKLTQISIKVSKYVPRQPHHSTQGLSPVLSMNYSKQKIKQIPFSPGHTELWYFGWTPSWYRKSFPLYPLPMAVFTSLITHVIEQDSTLKTNLEVTFHPQLETMQLRNRRQMQRKTVPFISMDFLKKLQQKIEVSKPSEEYYIEHRERVNAALSWSKNNVPQNLDDRVAKNQHRKKVTFDGWDN